ncbi:MAG: glucohydrolase [Mucilaginibacter sp.]|nr:glucohydrolase [Mucilaginibacter sp.]
MKKIFLNLLIVFSTTITVFGQTQGNWWKDTFIYQIYPRSFQDSNGDGIGDLKGITSRLDYLKSLGVETIWLSPIFKSPMDDMGYDISNYTMIDPIFGTMADFDEMLAGMKKRNIRLILDLVVNHTSDEHPWFKEARKSKDNPYHDYYIWKSGTKGVPPNNWFSLFGGSAWEWNEATQEYFLHFFSKKQVDLNWQNPKMRDEIYKAMTFWLNKGVSGYRMDVITFISKSPTFENIKFSSNRAEMLNGLNGVVFNGPHIHEYLKEMNDRVLSKYNLYTVGEGAGISLNNIDPFINPENHELQTFYTFDHMYLDKDMMTNKPTKLDLVKFKAALSAWGNKLDTRGLNTIYLGNHDQVRSLSRFGDDKVYRNESGKMLATLLFTQANIPFFLQGDELGMSNTTFKGKEELRDVFAINAYNQAIKRFPVDSVMKSISAITRDQSRTPFQWDNSANAGFSSGQPWLKVNSNYTTVNVKNEKTDPNSIFNFYKKVIKLRKGNPALIQGAFNDIAPEHPEVYAYTRELNSEKCLIILNLTSKNTIFSYKPGKLILSNYTDDKGEALRPYEAKVYKIQ